MHLTPPPGSDMMPLSDEPLSADESRAVRALLVKSDREKWALRRARVVVPVLVAVVTAAWQAIDWVLRHVTIKP